MLGAQSLAIAHDSACDDTHRRRRMDAHSLSSARTGDIIPFFEIALIALRGSRMWMRVPSSPIPDRLMRTYGGRCPHPAAGRTLQHGCERAPPLALPAGWACCPPDPLQLMHVARLMHRHMPSLCQTCTRYCRISSAHKHARQALGTSVHQIRVPRDKVPGRGCRGGGPPLPPARVGHLHLI
jgi:hypothetical protein